MKIANYKTKLRIKLTKDEHRMVGGGRVDVLYRPTTERLLIVRAGVEYTTRETPDGVHIEAQPPKDLPQFGSQEVKTSLVNGTLQAGRPNFGVTVRRQRRQKPRAKEANGTPPVTLDAVSKAVRTINDYRKQDNPDDVVISVGEDGFVEVVTRIGA